MSDRANIRVAMVGWSHDNVMGAAWRNAFDSISAALVFGYDAGVIDTRTSFDTRLQVSHLTESRVWRTHGLASEHRSRSVLHPSQPLNGFFPAADARSDI